MATASDQAKFHPGQSVPLDSWHPDTTMAMNIVQVDAERTDFGHARPSRIQSSAPSSRSAPSLDPDQMSASTVVATAFGHARTTSTRSTAQGSRASLLLFRKPCTTSYSLIRLEFIKRDDAWDLKKLTSEEETEKSRLRIWRRETPRKPALTPFLHLHHFSEQPGQIAGGRYVAHRKNCTEAGLRRRVGSRNEIVDSL